MKTEMHNAVFIVEDNEMYSTMLDYLLSTCCTCRFMRFKTGEECIQNLYMNPLVVILDYGLPGIDGLKTMKEIKKYKPDTEVVVLTSKDDKNIARTFFNEGAYDYMLKEKNAVQKIARIIDNMLNNRNAIENKNSSASLMNTLLAAIFLMGLLFLALMLMNHT